MAPSIRLLYVNILLINHQTAWPEVAWPYIGNPVSNVDWPYVGNIRPEFCMTVHRFLRSQFWVAVHDMRMPADDADVFRQVKCLYIRGKIISRKFANCSINVKLVVFKTYCSCLYTSQLWGTCLSRTVNRLKVAYNDSLRMVLGIPRYCSASEMFAYTNVPSCQCVIRLNIYSFMKRIQCMNNEIVHSIVHSDLIFSSLLWLNWRRRLFFASNS